MSAKTRKSLNSTLWVTCDRCHITLSQKDTNLHSEACCHSEEEVTHDYIKNNILYSFVEVYCPKDLPPNIEEKDTHNMVFMSQSALELCQIAIGDWVIIKNRNCIFSKIAWVTKSNSLTSVCLTKQTIDFYQLKDRITVQRFTRKPTTAKEIVIEYIGKESRPKIVPETRAQIKTLHNRQVFCVGNRIKVPFFGKHLLFKIVDINGDQEKNSHNTENKEKNLNDTLNDELIEQLESVLQIEDVPKFYEALDSTKWTIIGDEDEIKIPKQKLMTTLRDIGGYQHLLNELKDVFNIVLGKYKKVLKGFKFSKGILIYGPIGVGKSAIANALISEYDVNVFVIKASDIYSKYFGEGDKKLSQLFTEAKSFSPSVILIEDIDILCTKKSNSENEKRLLATLIQEIDNLQESDINTLLITTSSKPDLVDASLRRAGRIDREFEIGAPTPSMRREILQKLLSKLPNSVTNEELDEISFITHGFVAADLRCLCSQAAMRAIKRHNMSDTSDSTDVFICGNDFTTALTAVKPSAMKEVLVEVPNVKWSEIGGQKSLKLKLKQAVEWPLKHPEAFSRLGITPPRGVLMFGPPGCSKTMVARALATESKLNFINIKGPELFSKWVGESEKAVREVFRKARQVAPSIVFIDEIDALGGERASGNTGNTSNNVQERVLAQLLTELDGVTALGNVTLVAATNRPDRIDKALLRPGRLDRIVYVPLPDNQTRLEIFLIKFNKMPIADDVNVQDLVELTEGYSGAEIQAICHEAAMNALEDNLEAKIITKNNFKAALSIVSPRTPASLVKLYEDYQNNK
ncbi:ATPase family protein 2 homolog [Chelonus insularis]|uniref:ATPase family protein 2 homolog n=1 Tax=Chelonus insularis TaxID=460826 RepID=UPI0015895141|nr:ATPase family protein 2 homolog [Chelonus insularis]